MIVTATAGSFGALPPIVTGLRTLGNDTPILNSWAGDGTYWVPKDPQVTNYYFVTYASVFGDDPNPAVNKLAKQLGKARTGSAASSPAPAAIDGVVTAINRAGGSTTGVGARRADGEVQEGADALGPRQLLADLHTVFGRQYRVIRIQNNAAKVIGSVTREGRPEDLGTARRPTRSTSRTADGPEDRSGPPASPAPSRACTRCRTSRSSCTATRWSA